MLISGLWGDTLCFHTLFDVPTLKSKRNVTLSTPGFRGVKDAQESPSGHRTQHGLAGSRTFVEHIRHLTSYTGTGTHILCLLGL